MVFTHAIRFQQPLHPPVFPAGSGQNTYFKPIAFSGADQLNLTSRFKRISEAERKCLVEKTDQEAIQLLSVVNGRPKNQDELLKAVKAAFDKDGRYELLIYDAKQKPWVGKACDENCNNAFFQPSNRALYGKPTVLKPFSANFPPEYQQALKDLEALSPNGKTRVAIFLGNSGNLSTVKHELYHALQFKNGLPFGTDLETDNKALEMRDRLSTFPYRINLGLPFLNRYVASPLNCVLNGLWGFGRRIAAWLFEVPYLWLTGRMKSEKTSGKPTVGEALRVNMAREKEVDGFFRQHGKKADIPFSDRLIHTGLHYLFESQLQYLRSYKYD